jgi:hypothetical protein
MEGPEQAADDEGVSEPNKLSKEEKTAKERALLIEKVANADYDTLTVRVAWVLNHSVAARDSDITLQIKYWQAFESALISGSGRFTHSNR